MDKMLSRNKQMNEFKNGYELESEKERRLGTEKESERKSFSEKGIIKAYARDVGDNYFSYILLSASEALPLSTVCDLVLYYS